MMINSVSEWAEIALFALLVSIICLAILLIGVLMAGWYLCLAVYDCDFKWIIE